MFIDIIPLQKNTARLTRVYGDAPCAVLPASVPGPEGGVLAITELGDYCFSEKPRSLPGADALCRYEVGPDGTCTLVQAFGRDLTRRHGRYDLDFGEGAAAPEELHPVCGNFVEEITQITSRITAIGRRLEIRVPIFISFMYFVCAVARIIQIYADIGVTAFVGESPSL